MLKFLQLAVWIWTTHLSDSKALTFAFTFPSHFPLFLLPDPTADTPRSPPLIAL